MTLSTAACGQNVNLTLEPRSAAKTKSIEVTPEEEAFILKERLILRHVKADFPDTLPTDKEFLDSVLSLLPQILDRHSMYLTPEETTLMAEDQNGSFGGVGVKIQLAAPETELEGKAVLEVTADPDKNTPGAKAGMQKNDRIIAVNDVPVEPNLTKAVLRIRGPLGTTVKLTVVREGSPAPLTFTLIRENIIVEGAHLTYALKDDIAVITLPYFSSTVKDEFEAKTGPGPDVLAKKVKSVILDLRNDPGGNLQVCRAIASYWTNTQQTVVKVQSKTKTETLLSVPTVFSFAGIRTVVLVNGNSASCSEVTIGALRDWHAATIVGTTTFGKGLVQHVIPFSDGSSLIVTSAIWLTPNGRHINKWGFKPDILVERTREDEKAKRDPQMDRALEYLKTGK